MNKQDIPTRFKLDDLLRKFDGDFHLDVTQAVILEMMKSARRDLVKSGEIFFPDKEYVAPDNYTCNEHLSSDHEDVEMNICLVVGQKRSIVTDHYIPNVRLLSRCIQKGTHDQYGNRLGHVMGFVQREGKVDIFAYLGDGKVAVCDLDSFSGKHALRQENYFRYKEDEMENPSDNANEFLGDKFRAFENGEPFQKDKYEVRTISPYLPSEAVSPIIVLNKVRATTDLKRSDSL